MPGSNVMEAADRPTAERPVLMPDEGREVLERVTERHNERKAGHRVSSQYGGIRTRMPQGRRR